MTPIETVLEVIGGARRSGSGWSAKCPAHEDRAPSLSISEGDDGRVLLYCHAGCPFASIVRAAGLEEGDLFPPKDQNGKRVVAEYAYKDERGAELFRVVRFEPKDFRQKRRVGDAWVWNLNGTRRVLYRLPELLEGVKAGATVYAVEGEKDVEALRSLGLVATCNPMGAGKWRDEYADALRDARVVVIADRDEPGRKHAAAVLESLSGKAASLAVVEVETGKDAADWIAAGATREDFEGLKSSGPVEPGAEGEGRKWTGVYGVAEILASETYTGPRYPTGLEPLDELLTPYYVSEVLAASDRTRIGLFPGKVLALVGQPHKGKTTIAAQISHALALQGARVCALLDDEPRREFAARLAQMEGFAPGEVAVIPDYPATLAKIGERFAELDLGLYPDIDHDNPRPTIEDVAERLLSRPAKLHVLVIDSLHKATCRAEAAEDGALERIEKKCTAIRRLRAKGVITIFTAEANRASYASPDPARRTNAIAASGDSRAVEFLADIQLVVSAAEGELFGVEVPKNRLTGKLGKFTLALDRERARFGPVSDKDAKARAEDEQIRRDEKAEETARIKILATAVRNPKGIKKGDFPQRAHVKKTFCLSLIDQLVEGGELAEREGPQPKGGGRKPILIYAPGRSFAKVPNGSADGSRTIERGGEFEGSPPIRGNPELSLWPPENVDAGTKVPQEAGGRP